MNKIHLCVLPLALLLAAYSGQSVAGDPKRSTDAEKIKDCDAVANAPMVNFNVNSMKATPECIRVYKGSTIVFRLTPKKGLEDVVVTIEPKDAFKDSWLQGRNHPFNDIIIIGVPGEFEDKSKRTEHDYVVVVDDQKIDPRVEVDH